MRKPLILIAVLIFSACADEKKSGQESASKNDVLCDTSGYVGPELRSYELYFKEELGVIDLKIQDPVCDQFVQPLQFTTTSREIAGILIRERIPDHENLGFQVIKIKGSIEKAQYLNPNNKHSAAFFMVTSIRMFQ